MPPRPVILAIVAFWLATSVWLFQRELWPRLRPGEPPPYTIDLVDEARNSSPIRWAVYRGDEKIGKASTSVSYDETDDTFKLHGVMEQLELYRSRFPGGPVVKVQKVASMYRVSREGELREIVVDLAGSAELLGGFERFDLLAHVAGRVEERRFAPHGYVEWPGGKKELKADPVAVSTYGSVLNPLHPVNRILGLRPGQQWRMPLVDPLADALAAVVADTVAAKLPGLSSGPRFLDAVVSGPQDLAWGGQEVSCLVIEYKGDSEVTARTWVRVSDGLVLRQEARQGDLLVLQRDPP